MQNRNKIFLSHQDTKKGIKQIKSSIDFLSPGSPSQYKSTQNNHLKPLIQKKNKKKKITENFTFLPLPLHQFSFICFYFFEGKVYFYFVLFKSCSFEFDSRFRKEIMFDC